MTARDPAADPAREDRVRPAVPDAVVPAVFDPLADTPPTDDDAPRQPEPPDDRAALPASNEAGVSDDEVPDDGFLDDAPDGTPDDMPDDVSEETSDRRPGDTAADDEAEDDEAVDDDAVDARVPSDDELARPLYDPLPPSDDELDDLPGDPRGTLAESDGEPADVPPSEPDADETATDDAAADDAAVDDAAADEGLTDEQADEQAAAQAAVPATSAGLVDVPSRSGWATLARAMAPRATRAQIAAGVLCALLGFAVVVQVRQNDESALSGLRQSELVRVLDETTERGDQLRREVSELRGERDRLASGSDGQAAAIDSLRRSAITQGILSGRLPAQGPGVQVTLLDPGRDLQPVTMLNMLEELRNAGAEAIQLNDRRITASSAFTGTRGDVLLDGERLEPPYVWSAIGDPSTLSIALQIPGGAMATVRGTGATGTVEERDEVVVSAVRTLPDPAYASPVPIEAG
ncbi:DUF881 domain-containing protein [Cellulomonas uda]|uniref:DUF881 domain-containing protein n=1 Tax=Cellulomonas uda TaxID=1714 RepID=A0A4Y3K9Q6_CELUD|nr:DUF881 domain-containing protein [Cellulomonas uda]NII65857.1 uncharacterized protein YlxW (UPF0749 family) [Cellulomonas uda]GEA80702.1 hypothetical protein CUD01_11460 [Cellulomonas uda]